MAANKSRESGRATIQLVARYRSPAAFEFVTEECLDVSAGGMFIRADQPAPVGTLLKLECETNPGNGDIVRAVARVVWIREAASEGPTGMGVKFVKLETGSEAALERLLSQLQPTLDPSGAKLRGSVPPGSSNSVWPAARTSSRPAPPPERRPAPSSIPPVPPPGRNDAVEATSPVATATDSAPVSNDMSSDTGLAEAAHPGSEAAAYEPSASAPSLEDAENGSDSDAIAAELAEDETADEDSVNELAGEVVVATDQPPGDDQLNEPAAEDMAQAALMTTVDDAELSTNTSHEPDSEAQDLNPVAAAPSAASEELTPVAMVPARQIDAQYAESHRPEPALPFQPATMVSAEALTPDRPRQVYENSKEETTVAATRGLSSVWLALAAVVLLGGAIALKMDRHPSSTPAATTSSAPAATPEATQAPQQPERGANLPGANGIPAATEEANAAAATTAGGPYLLEVETQPAGAEVQIGDQRVTSPARVQLSAVAEPLRVRAVLAGHNPKATLIEAEMFVDRDGQLYKKVTLQLTKSP